MSLDGFAILKSVAGHAELFSDARDAVDKAALNILASQFKAKTFDLDRLKRVYKVLGADSLSLALEHLPDTVPKGLLRRIDPHHPQAASMRSRIVALASGAAKPEARPEKRVKKKVGSVKGKDKPQPKEDSIAVSFWASSVMAKPQRSSKTRRQSK